MSRWRWIVVAVLFCLPVVLMVGVGAFTLWESGRLVWLCWVPPICWLLAYGVLRFRPRRSLETDVTQESLPTHWTERDEKAFEIVRREQQAASEIPVASLSDPHFYLQAAIDLSTKVAQHYHPKSSDPISSLTVVEVLAAAQLSAEETSAWLNGHVPGSHLLTIQHWRTLSNAPRWVRIASDASWLISMFWNPANLPRWLASRFASSSASQEIEASLLGTFYREFLHNVGLYCIEMNSGRLRGGVARYRATMQRIHDPAGNRQPFSATFDQRLSQREPITAGDGRAGEIDSADGIGATNAPSVRIAFVGQVNAGKSSLINSFLGENRAKCDVLAATNAIERYRFTVGDTGQQFELMDTPGYGSAELTDEQRNSIRMAWSQADIVLLVMDVTSPARQADWRLVSELANWYAVQNHLKAPPLIGVLTHIDGLSPMMEWQPPYNWNWPTRPKEKSIRAAVDYTEQIFADKLTAVIPVCSDSAHARSHGIEEWLLPAVLASLSEAKASLIVRTLHQDADAEQLKQLVRQFRSAGVKLLQSLLEARTKV